MSLNATLPPLPSYTLSPQAPLIPGLEDKYLTLILPVAAYWITSLFWHIVDTLDLFPQYRLHTPAEVLKRNHVSRYEVFRDVILQHIIQTVFGLVGTMLDPEPTIGQEEFDIAVWAQRIRLVQRAIPQILLVGGVKADVIARNILDTNPTIAAVLSGGKYNIFQETPMGQAAAFAGWELKLASFIYWVGFPALQFVFAIFVVDTWQYFWHRAMHLNKWLYTAFHSRHHRLYVPYAYGALYNHPVEGFLMDTLGTAVAYFASGMTARQAMWFFTCTTIKTVDDHCGYALPFDPMQHLTSNNAGYHDVHHQSWGIKTNFSQPFFTVWDRFMGTKWTGGDVSLRYERSRKAAQKAVEDDNAQSVAPITSSDGSESKTDANDLGPYVDAAAADSKTKRMNGETRPEALPGKAAAQALSSRDQVVTDSSPAGGSSVLQEETAEEQREESLRRSPRKKTSSTAVNTSSSNSSASLKGLRERVGGSFHGRGGVLTDSSR